MTFSHVSQVEQVKQAIHAKRDRCLSITNRADAIRSAIPWMNENDLLIAGQELAELRKEMMEHEQYILKAEQWISEFYKNPIRGLAA